MKCLNFQSDKIEPKPWIIQLQSRLKRPGCQPETLPPLSNLSCPIPTQSILPMVQHVDNWVTPFPRSQQFPLPPQKFFHSPPSPPPSSSPRLRARELGAIINIIVQLFYYLLDVLLKTFLTEKYVWEHPHLPSGFLFGLSFINIPPLPPPPPEPT